MKKVLIGCGAVFGLFLLLGACVAIVGGLSDDTTTADQPEENAEKEPEEKEESKKGKNDKLPEIPDEAKKIAVDQIKMETLVEDALVQVEGDKVILAIVVNAATNEETAKEYGDNFARMLSSMTDAYNEDVDLDSPTKDYIGGLWDYYDLQVGVGTGPDNFIVQGAKVTSAKKITW